MAKTQWPYQTPKCMNHYDIWAQIKTGFFFFFLISKKRNSLIKKKKKKKSGRGQYTEYITDTPKEKKESIS